jgi:endonuclease YncB( thermonuclease family)
MTGILFRNWRVAARATALALLASFTAAGFAEAQDIPGEIRVRGPGVVNVGAYWVHLLGVRAPGTHGATQYRQEGYAEDLCEIDGVPFQCGLIAQGELARLSAGIVYLCELQHFDGDPRHWGICRPYDPFRRQIAEGPSINQTWVQSGWALADPTYTDAFVGDEAEARAAGRGLWATAPDAPLAPKPDMPAQISGPATVVNGNVLSIGGVEVRLFGIDAPELFQSCTFISPDRSWSYGCGVQSRAALIRMTMGKSVYCVREEAARDTRALARCWEANAAGDGPADGAESFNEWMVRTGWALAYRGVTDEFVPLELEANRRDIGLHLGGRVAPFNWRRGHR